MSRKPVPGDNPITSRSDDELGRVSVAESFARDIRRVDASEGYVIALMGPWGSGKTSLINFIREELNEDPAVLVIDFNPWMFSGTDVLVNSFFREISAQLREKKAPHFAKVADQLIRYSELLTPLIWLPIIGVWAARMKSLSGSVKRFKDQSQESATEKKRTVSAVLAGLDRPIVVVVDDIDRLSEKEIQDIFKLVRLTASFPNIIYLLVFDRQRVESALSSDGMPGRSYLEKIVQSGVDLPSVPEHILLRQIGEALQGVIDNVGGVDLFDEGRWPDVLMEIIAPLIKNMRDVRRYAASVRSTVESLKEQIDLVDILALEVVRVFLPDVFAKLIGAQEALTTTASLGYSDHESPKLKADVEELLDIAGERRPLVEDLIRRMFPAGMRHLENNNYGSDWIKTWFKARRVAHVDVLKLYLERTASDGMAAFNDAEKSFGLLGDSEALDEFLKSLPKERLADVVAALGSFEGDYPAEGVVPGVTVLLNLLPQMPEKLRGMFTLDARMVVTQVVRQMLQQLEAEDGVGVAVDKIMPNVETLSSKFELVRIVGHVEGIGYKLVPIAKAEDLQATLADEISNASAEKLAFEWNLLRLLLAPKHWDLGDPKTIETDADLSLHFAVFTSATSETRSQAMGNRHVQRTKTLDWDVLRSIYGSEKEIRLVLEQMNSHPQEHSDELRELIGKYLDGWRPNHDD